MGPNAVVFNTPAPQHMLPHSDIVMENRPQKMATSSDVYALIPNARPRENEFGIAPLYSVPLVSRNPLTCRHQAGRKVSDEKEFSGLAEQRLQSPIIGIGGNPSVNGRLQQTIICRQSNPAKQKRPAMYDGKFCCKYYLVQFDIIAQLNGWDEITRAMELATSLNGRTRSVLTDIDPQLSTACKGLG